MTSIEDLKKTMQKSAPPTKGLVWLSMLIEYDYSTGQSKILQSYSRPAKDSTIKKFTKKKEEKPKFEEVKKTESKKLF